MAFKFRTGEEVNSENLLGIKEDDLKSQLKAGVEAKTKLGELETKLTTGIDEVKALIAGISSSGNGNAGGGGNDGGGGGNNGGGEGGNNNVDPTTMLALTATRTSLESRMEVIKMQLREKMNSEGGFEFPYWDQLIDDMMKLTEKDSLDRKANPVYWENAYHICFSKKNAALKDVKPRTRFNSEPVNNPAFSGQNQNSNDPSDIDKQQAAKFNIPIDKYMERKKQLTFVGV